MRRIQTILRRCKTTLKDNRGNGAVEFLASAMLLVLLFATFIVSLVYITNYYSACHVCRQIVEEIEQNGRYEGTKALLTSDIINDYKDNLDNLKASIEIYTDEMPEMAGQKIQLRQKFIVKLTADYSIPIKVWSKTKTEIPLSIEVAIPGRSSVYWKN